MGKSITVKTEITNCLMCPHFVESWFGDPPSCRAYPGWEKYENPFESRKQIEEYLPEKCPIS